ncbi:hypothetical protein E0485_02545 [Paenibacillus albiflavus]|uniref:Uncharacterized protein n=1 Tax=Paenibacillus albiflavus TaxID=2545760 RepID=A0A4R4ELN2_9BACL|nr:hypothetical protein [Paenibacillus albiflavus]TCZ81174.1 hypothetical protein E0485_02545 [Paenibacillus albiflavus]
MKKLNPIIIILSSVIAVIVLFGGFFVYQRVTFESPLANIINDQPSVEKATIEVTDNEINVDLKAKPDIDLREVMNAIYSQGGSAISKLNVNMNVEDQTSPELETWWKSILFDIAEAMETKAYGRIPEILHNQAPALDGIQISTDLDDHNVYIKLVHKNAYKIVILPRTPSQLGVPTNV